MSIGILATDKNKLRVLFLNDAFSVFTRLNLAFIIVLYCVNIIHSNGKEQAYYIESRPD